MHYRCDLDLLLKAAEDYLTSSNDELLVFLKQYGFVEPEMTVETLERMSDRMIEVFKRQQRLYADALEEDYLYAWENARARDTVSADIEEMAKDELFPFFYTLVYAYIAEADNELRRDLLRDRTAAWLSESGKVLGEQLKDSSQSVIVDLYKKAAAKGWDVPTLTDALLSGGAYDEYYKAHRAAITEIFRQHEYAKNEARMQNPAVKYKTWRHTNRQLYAPRDNHVAISGQTVLKEKPFVLSGRNGGEYHPMHPHDSSLPAAEVINCYCITEGVTDEQIADMPPEERRRMQEEGVIADNEEWHKENS